ncbi:MAG TPA: hypothetical protein VF977_14610 [Candidatus Binatia bacterium]
MDDNRDEKLDLLLRSRRVESATPDLAQRIILQARQLPQNKTFSLWQWLRELCVEFHLPKPAYVLATALIFGLVIGFSTPPDTTPVANDSVSSVSAQNVFSTDEALL